MDKPFAILEQWVKDGRIHLSHHRALDPADEEPRDFAVRMPEGMTDTELFSFAMKDVKSLGWSAVPLHPRPPVEIQPQDEEQDALRVLEQFIRGGNPETEETGE